jgi:hypothetical protein
MKMKEPIVKDTRQLCEYCPQFEFNWCKLHNKKLRPGAEICDEVKYGVL